jgi:diguanylate cyclase (GGDEF)-like protein
MLTDNPLLLFTQLFAVVSLAILTIQLLAMRKSRKRADNLLKELEIGKREYKLLQYRATSNKVMMEISGSFVGCDKSDLDSALKNALKKAGTFFQAHRSSIFMIDEASESFSCMMQWCEKGISEQGEELQDVALQDFSWETEQIKQQKSVAITNVKSIEEVSPALFHLAKESGTKSILDVPMVNRNKVLGWIRIEDINRLRKWSTDETNNLNLIAEIFAAELAHLSAEHAVSDSQRNIQNMIAYAPVAMFVINPKGKIQYAEGRALARAGFIGSHLTNKTVEQAFPESFSFIEATQKALKGEDSHVQISIGKRHFEAHVNVVLGPSKKIRSIVITAIDKSDRLNFEKRLAKEKLYHPISGLPNRKLIREKLCNQLQKHQEDEKDKLFLLTFHIDRSAPLTSALGQITIDELIREFSARLASSFGAQGALAQLSEFNFCLVAEGLETKNEARQTARLIREIAAQPFFINDQQVNISVSVGIAQAHGNLDSEEQWLSEAQTACVAANKNGGNTEHFFQPSLANAALSSWQLSEQLKQALAEDLIEAWLQPIVQMETGQPIGFESLARWANKDGDFIPPSEFVPIAEEYGLMGQLGDLMLRKSCKALSQCHRINPKWKKLYVSINVASTQLERSSFLDSLSQLAKNYSLTPEHIQIEITEREAVNPNQEIVPLLNKARDMGYRIALDDFGTGYNSLSYLNSLPATSLKIDRSFVTGMNKSQTGEKVIASILSLAQTIKIDTITEGIETEEQKENVLKMGCSYAQGFLFAKPMPPKEMPNFLANIA